MSIIFSISFCNVAFAYSLSILIRARLFSRLSPIVLLRYVFKRGRALKDLSAEQEVAGIVAKIENTLQVYTAREALHLRHFHTFSSQLQRHFLSGHKRDWH